MKTVAKVGAIAVAVTASCLTVVSPAHAATGFSIKDGRLIDANGKDFVMRGISHAHTWYQDKTAAAIPAIKAAGANTVRIVLANGGQWTKNDAADVAKVISLCEENKLIAVLEVHDTTGYGDTQYAPNAVPLSDAAKYWVELKSVLAGTEDHVIVNIGNEPIGNDKADTWTAATQGAIKAVRAGGIKNTLMVDAPNWGQDWSGTMKANAPAVLAADPAKNTILSVHMYGVYGTADKVTSYLDTFVTAKLPIVVGEFGYKHSDGDVDEATIMSYAQQKGIGWMAWSWSGNGGGVEYLDMVTSFSPAAPTEWGKIVIDGPNGLKATSKEASVFGRTPPTTGGGGTCTAAATTAATAKGFKATLTVSNDKKRALDPWKVTVKVPAKVKVLRGVKAEVTQQGTTVTLSPKGTRTALASGASLTVGFVATGPTDAVVKNVRLNGARCGS